MKNSEFPSNMDQNSAKIPPNSPQNPKDFATPRGFQGDSRPRPVLLSYAAWASPWLWPPFRSWRSARFRRQKGQVLEASSQVLDGIDLDEIIIWLEDYNIIDHDHNYYVIYIIYL